MHSKQPERISMSIIQAKLLTEIEAAKYICMSRSFLRQGRMNGDRKNRTPSPPYLRIGTRAIRYDIQSLNNWLEQFQVNKMEES